jgi:hypothetical protein
MEFTIQNESIQELDQRGISQEKFSNLRRYFMLTMEEYANKYLKQHRGKGRVSDVTKYSFKWTTLPLKENEKPVTYVFMLSYFLEYK